MHQSQMHGANFSRIQCCPNESTKSKPYLVGNLTKLRAIDQVPPASLIDQKRKGMSTKKRPFSRIHLGLKSTSISIRIFCIRDAVANKTKTKTTRHSTAIQSEARNRICSTSSMSHKHVNLHSDSQHRKLKRCPHWILTRHTIKVKVMS